MAARFWPGEDALGKRIRTTPTSPWLTVVGIVADSKEAALGAEGLIGMYLPYSIAPNSSINVIVHTATDMISVAGVVRNEIRLIDADVAIARLRQLDEIVAASIGSRSFTGTLLAIFAGIALLLAVAGIYGVLAYAVNQRIREIGVRMALGASRRTVLKEVITDGLRLILPGVAIGALASLAATDVLSSLLFGVTATDPFTFVTIAVLVILVGAIACYIPARRGASVDPLVALRNE
jgi:putative ABC transport system permease protein